MSKSLRLVLFLSFCVAFFISAPLVVLYTSGYRFDLTHGRIVHTAVLNISSEPRHARVLIDGSIASDKTPAVLETILPGEHLVGLEKDGYLAWETMLSFGSREAMVLGPIILFLDEQPKRQQHFNTSITASHAQTNQFAYATQMDSWVEVWVVDASELHTKLLIRLPYTATNSSTLQFSPHGTYLAFIENPGPQQEVTVARVANGTLVELPAKAEDADVELLPFYKQGHSVWEGRLITLTESGNKNIVSYQDGETASIITYLPLGEYMFVEAPGNLVALAEIRHHRLILLDPANREQPMLFNEEARLWSWHWDGDFLLYSSGFDLKRYVRSTHETQTVTRLSTPIEYIDWYPTGTTLLYHSDGQTIALSLDGGTILSQTILSQDLNGTFWIDQSGAQLNILHPSEKTVEWWSRELQN